MLIAVGAAQEGTEHIGDRDNGGHFFEGNHHDNDFGGHDYDWLGTGGFIYHYPSYYPNYYTYPSYYNWYYPNYYTYPGYYNWYYPNYYTYPSYYYSYPTFW